MTATTEVVADAAENRLDSFLASRGLLPSRAVATRLVRGGMVQVNGRPARPSRSLEAGDRVTLQLPDPEAAVLVAEDVALDVVFEDADLLVINKPAGMVVHPGAGQPAGTLVNALLGLHRDWPSMGAPMRPGIVHRLDKGTSGLLIVARTDAAHRRLSADLADRRVSRVYLALCRGRVDGPGRIEGPIGRDPRERKRMAVVEGGRAATTTFEVLEKLRDASYLEVRLMTGRTHQIRVHLSAIQHPLLGDATYGSAGAMTRIDRPALHAHRLTFRHPSHGEELTFSAPPPSDFMAALEALRQ